MSTFTTPFITANIVAVVVIAVCDVAFVDVAAAATAATAAATAGAATAADVDFAVNGGGCGGDDGDENCGDDDGDDEADAAGGVFLQYKLPVLLQTSCLFVGDAS